MASDSLLAALALAVSAVGKDEAGWRRHTYLNLIFFYYLMLYTAGEFNDDVLLQVLRMRFTTAEAREYWEETHHGYRQQAASRKQINFHTIAMKAFAEHQAGSATDIQTTNGKPVKPDSQP